MKFNRVAMIMTLLALSGCVTPTPYRAADADHRNGYSDQRLADNRIRVTFRGNSATLREQVESYLMLRSAEATRDAGYAWFAFDTRDTEAKTIYHTDFAGWPGWGPGFGWYRHSWAFDPLGRVQTTIPTTRYTGVRGSPLRRPNRHGRIRMRCAPLMSSRVLGPMRALSGALGRLRTKRTSVPSRLVDTERLRGLLRAHVRVSICARRIVGNDVEDVAPGLARARRRAWQAVPAADI
jgi:hypothetical protein